MDVNTGESFHWLVSQVEYQAIHRRIFLSVRGKNSVVKWFLCCTRESTQEKGQCQMEETFPLEIQYYIKQERSPSTILGMRDGCRGVLRSPVSPRIQAEETNKNVGKVKSFTQKSARIFPSSFSLFGALAIVLQMNSWHQQAEHH